MTPTDKPTQVGGLLPCPFCGDDNLGHKPDCYMALCGLPDMPPPAVMETAWNRRAYAQVGGLLPLPSPIRMGLNDVVPFDGYYTADQMYAYAQANVQALEALEREAERYRWLRDVASRAQLETFADRRGTRLAADRVCDSGIDAALLESKP
jgi:hypothetical protein